MFTEDINRNEVLNETSIAILKRQMSADLELYSYVQSRFYMTLKKVIEYRAYPELGNNSCLFASANPDNPFTNINCAW